MLNKALDWFSKTKLWEQFAGKYLAHFTFRTMGYTKFPIDDYFKIVDLAEPDTFYGFACSDYESLAAKSIKWAVDGVTYFTHAGILVLDGDRGSRIHHMKGEGLRTEHPLRMLKEVDYVAICKVKLKPGTYAEAKRRLDELLANRDKIKYDYQQEISTKPELAFYIYCSELFFRLFDGLIDDPDMKVSTVLGRDAFVPDAVFRCGELLYSNHPDLQKCVVDKQIAC